MKELYSENLDKVQGAISELWQNDQSYKSSLARQWELNVNCNNGIQNLNYANLLRGPDGQILFPRSNSESNLYISNEIGPAGRAIISFITRSKPSVEIFGIEDSENSKLKSYIAEKIHEAKYDLDDELMNSIQSAEWGFCTGTSVRKDWWDSSYGDSPEIPVFDDYGNELIDPETGKVVMRKTLGGRNQVTISSPIAFAIDPSCTNERNLEWIQEGYLAPTDWISEVYDRDEKGYYPENAKLIPESSSVSDTISRLEDLKYSVSIHQTPFFGRPPSKGKCIVLETYLKPNKLFPYGRLIVSASGKIIYCSTPEVGSPYYMPVEPLMWHPYSFFFYEPYVGRFWGKSAVEQVLSLQMRLNQIYGAVLKNAETIACPNIIAADNQLQRGVTQGGGSKIWTYTPRPDAPPPTIMEGVPLPSQFFNEASSIVDRIVRILGTNFVMQGDAPKGVSAAAAISQLLENANTQQSPIVQAFERFHTNGFTKKLRVIRKFNNLPMKDLNDYLKNIIRGSLKIEREAFTREDLSDGIGVKVVTGSMMAKSDLVKRQTYLEFAEKGLMGPITEDSPRGSKIRSQLFKALGEKMFDTEDSIEVQKAEHENDLISQGKAVEVGEYDAHPVHISCHLIQYQNPRWQETASDLEKQLALQHIKDHEASEKMKQEKQMLEQISQQQQIQSNIEGPPQNLSQLPAQNMAPQNIPGGLGI